jgi:WD40 repeat protein
MTDRGHRALTGSEDGSIDIWDTVNGELQYRLEAGDLPFDVSVSADGAIAVSASDLQSAQVWDLQTLAAARAEQGHLEGVHSVAVTADGRWAFTGSHREVIFWNLETRLADKGCSFGDELYVDSVFGNDEGTRLTAAAADNTIRIVDDLWGKRNVLVIKRGIRGGKDIALTADGRLLLARLPQNAMMLYDLETDQVVQSFLSQSGAISEVAMDSLGRRAISAAGRTAEFWNVETGKSVGTIHVADRIEAVAISRDGTCTLISLNEAGVEIRRFGEQTLLARLPLPSPARALAMSWDNRRIATGSLNGLIQLWDTKGALHA